MIFSMIFNSPKSAIDHGWFDGRKTVSIASMRKIGEGAAYFSNPMVTL